MRNKALRSELLVVISVIGLIGTLSTVSFSTSKAKAKIAGGLSFEQTVHNVVGDDAVGVWNFDDCSGSVAIDSSGNGHDATLIGPPTWSSDTPSKNGCSLSFDGSGDQLDPAFDWTIQHQSFTASAWFKTKKALSKSYL